jgi:single-stranded-DNA-specific exonuclease
VTVDCGAMAHEALGTGPHDVGIDVIVVDHHKCARRPPASAVALVNPNRLDESDRRRGAYGHLAAVGVAFLLGVALVRTLSGRGDLANART